MLAAEIIFLLQPCSAALKIIIVAGSWDHVNTKIKNVVPLAQQATIRCRVHFLIVSHILAISISCPLLLSTCRAVVVGNGMGAQRMLQTAAAA